LLDIAQVAFRVFLHYFPLSSESGPDPWAVVLGILVIRFAEWALVAWATGLSCLLDLPAAILTGVLGFATHSIHLC
jgi:hypothetical protein